jgi:DNA-binding NarL/FixJ family response regulator
MAAVAIFSSDPTLRDALDRLLRPEPGISILGVAQEPTALDRLLHQRRVDAVLADAPRPAQLGEWLRRYRTTAFVVLVDETEEEEALDALYAGARAIIARSAGRAELLAALRAAAQGLAVLPPPLLETLMEPGAPEAGVRLQDGAGNGLSAVGKMLTARELDVLAAMADGASNKAIARRLGISFHTAKFHVAAILAKLDADSRTEAVAKAAHLGLVML